MRGRSCLCLSPVRQGIFPQFRRRRKPFVQPRYYAERISRRGAGRLPPPCRYGENKGRRAPNGFSVHRTFDRNERGSQGASARARGRDPLRAASRRSVCADAGIILYRMGRFRRRCAPRGAQKRRKRFGACSESVLVQHRFARRGLSVSSSVRQTVFRTRARLAGLRPRYLRAFFGAEGLFFTLPQSFFGAQTQKYR